MRRASRNISTTRAPFRRLSSGPRSGFPCVEDCLDERLGDVLGSEFVASRSCQRDRLLVGLQIRDARRAHRQMPLEFDALIRRQLVVTVARDEVDELLTRDVRLGGQGILPLNVEQ